MERSTDCRGMACPLPVVNAKKELAGLTKGDVLTVRVDNEIAVQNLTRFGERQGHAVTSEKVSEDDYSVTFRLQTENAASAGMAAEDASGTNVPANESVKEAADGNAPASGGKCAVVISSDRMGSGKEALGKTLMKAFLFALTSQDKVPDYLIFYNRGAFLTCGGSESLEDIRAVEAAGCRVMTCGTCLNFYELTEQLQAGTVSNMYDIVEAQMQCTTIIRP